jgi:thioredoxin reductase
VIDMNRTDTNRVETPEPAEATVTRRVWDVVVVGGGAAAWSAALVLGRARRSVLVIDGGQPRNAAAEHMHGYLSRDGLPPGELLRLGRMEAQAYGVAVLNARVLRIDAGFYVCTDTGFAVRARRVLVATGLTDQLPDDVAGLRQMWGRDVHGCPYCHGWEARDQPLAVLGVDERSVHQALLLRQWSSDVVLVSHALGALPADARARLAAWSVQVREGRVTALVTESGRLTALQLADGTRLPRSAVFVMPRFVPNDGLLRQVGAQVGDDGSVVTDEWGRTSIFGLLAAGNVTDTVAQVIHAAAAGSRAAIAINGDLVAEDVDRALDAAASAGGGVFSPAAEREVSARVLGERRHGLDVVSAVDGGMRAEST